MAVERFHGKYIYGENARQYIDIDTINDACRIMKEASNKLNAISEKIDRLRELCSKDALSVDGEGMDERIEAYENFMNDFSLYIDDLSNTIRDTTQRVFNRKQIILNEEAKRMDQMMSLEKQNQMIQ